VSGAGEQRTVPPMQSLRAALLLSRREQISVIVAVLLIGAAALLPVFGKAYWLSIGISVAMFTVPPIVAHTGAPASGWSAPSRRTSPGTGC